MVHLQPIVESRSGQGAEWRGIWATEDDTLRFAQQLARSPQLAHATLTLEGDLGAGKTTLVRHLLRALGVQGRIKSPTYAVVEPHSVPGLDIWHFDFYRFSDPRELEDAGFRDIFASPGLKLVEWPRQAGAWLPQPDLEMAIGMLDDDRRSVVLHAWTARGQALLHDLAPAFASASTSALAQASRPTAP